MLLVALVLVGLILGWILGGKLSNLDLGGLRLWWLAPLALVLQLIPLEDPWAFPALMASYLALVVFAAVNLRRPGIALILLGLAMNWLVIGLNHGMPVDISAVDDPAAAARLQAEGGAKHHVMTGEDTLRDLGDTIWVLRDLYSPGDLVLYAGVAWFIAAGMRTRTPADDTRQAGRRNGPHWGAEESPSE